MKRTPCPRVDQQVRVGEAGIVPRYPLHDVVISIGSRDTVWRLLGLDDLFAKCTVPVQNPVLHCILIGFRRVGAIVKQNWRGDIETSDGCRCSTRVEFQLRLRLEELHVSVCATQILALGKRQPFVGRYEISNFDTRFIVSAKLTAAYMGALPNDQSILRLDHRKYTTVWHFQNHRKDPGIEATLRIPYVGHHPVHARVEINHHFRVVLLHYRKRRHELLRREIFRHDLTFAGVVHVDTVVEQFKSDDAASQSCAGRGRSLRNQRGRDHELFAQGGPRNGNSVVRCWFEGRCLFGMKLAG